ncbi:hypothetical protein FEM08_33640 [Flavobacterium gilvum]|nr:hypothetical protein FEM08_33640 [Flavobacterium gilvum]
MKVRFKLSQFQKILKSEPLKVPVIFDADDFTDKEFLQLLRLLQTN